MCFQLLVATGNAVLRLLPKVCMSMNVLSLCCDPSIFFCRGIEYILTGLILFQVNTLEGAAAGLEDRLQEAEGEVKRLRGERRNLREQMLAVKWQLVLVSLVLMCRNN
jgi:hypothetical protein